MHAETRASIVQDIDKYMRQLTQDANNAKALWVKAKTHGNLEDWFEMFQCFDDTHEALDYLCMSFKWGLEEKDEKPTVRTDT